MSKEARASNPEKDSTAAKSYETRQLEPVHGGIVAAAHQRRMYSPHVIGAGADRPGQAGPDPGNFLQDNHGPVVTNVHVVLMFWGSAWNDDKKPNPTVLQVFGALASIMGGPYMDGLAQYRGIAMDRSSWWRRLVRIPRNLRIPLMTTTLPSWCSMPSMPVPYPIRTTCPATSICTRSFFRRASIRQMAPEANIPRAVTMGRTFTLRGSPTAAVSTAFPILFR